MNKTRITELRQTQGWTQERLANESGIGLRTVQRLEAGEDASLETLSLVANALRVQVRDLFSTIDDAALSSRVDSLADRAEEQQVARDRISGAWRWLYIGVGVVVTLISFTFAQGMVLFLGYWVGGTMILVALRRLYLEPHLDAKYPLSRATRSRRERDVRPLADQGGAIKGVTH
ncbi:helix-turn-helix domain-containing protein [Mycetocola zhadangensis]|uniref:XRE family transcriptional regulator n=1 Tax=Mycetocola zhadangensis TaxID=1164595 RepID=A0A3L7IX04_9MICO|nr:helix-turn-helix transcriptional regulator [Mycetocola zhadangensis]RLQ82680.1 XRE family transcriptional regulator [Mycetocola zhadangensis]GGE99169.1 DNA-binding protein [Mycetocola zhadangensis]